MRLENTLLEMQSTIRIDGFVWWCVGMANAVQQRERTQFECFWDGMCMSKKADLKYRIMYRLRALRWLREFP